MLEALHEGALEHPNLIPVHRLGHDANGRPVLVMKRVTGTSWHELLQDPLHPTWQALPPERPRASVQVLILRDR